MMVSCQGDFLISWKTIIILVGKINSFPTIRKKRGQTWQMK